MTFDLTALVVAIVGGFFSIATIVVGAWINARMKDSAAAAAVNGAVKNALGAMQQAAQQAATSARPAVTIPAIPGVPPDLAVGVQYVLDHAGQEAARFGITAPAIADKLNAQIGLAAIASNVAAAAAPAPTPAPLAPIPPAMAVSARITP